MDKGTYFSRLTDSQNYFTVSQIVVFFIFFKAVTIIYSIHKNSGDQVVLVGLYTNSFKYRLIKYLSRCCARSRECKILKKPSTHKLMG